MKKFRVFLSNIWESATDGQKGSVVDIIKVIISWMKIFWNAVSSQLNALMNNQSAEDAEKDKA